MKFPAGKFFRALSSRRGRVAAGVTQAAITYPGRPSSELKRHPGGRVTPHPSRKCRDAANATSLIRVCRCWARAAGRELARPDGSRPVAGTRATATPDRSITGSRHPEQVDRAGCDRSSELSVIAAFFSEQTCNPKLSTGKVKNTVSKQ
ncbi:hypothetical protein Bbelb_204360 [Branchiostoma belcheri]|nr:hypothetical protein Bbelb_204360 [Branchiostoma belcheri]